MYSSRRPGRRDAVDGLSELLNPLVGAHHIREPDAELFVHHDDFTAGDQLVVDQHFHRFSREFIELNDGALSQLKQLPDQHACRADLHGHLQRNIKDELDILVGRHGVLVIDRWKRRRLWIRLADVGIGLTRVSGVVAIGQISFCPERELGQYLRDTAGVISLEHARLSLKFGVTFHETQHRIAGVLVKHQDIAGGEVQ